MATLIENLEQDIPRAEERLGFDARIVREMRRQLSGLKAEQQFQPWLNFPDLPKPENRPPKPG